MKQLFEKNFFKYQWLFIITLIVIHIEINYNYEVMNIFCPNLFKMNHIYWL